MHAEVQHNTPHSARCVNMAYTKVAISCGSAIRSITFIVTCTVLPYWHLVRNHGHLCWRSCWPKFSLFQNSAFSVYSNVSSGLKESKAVYIIFIHDIVGIFTKHDSLCRLWFPILQICRLKLITWAYTLWGSHHELDIFLLPLTESWWVGQLWGRICTSQQDLTPLSNRRGK